MAGDEMRIRRMTMADLDRVMEIADSLNDAPHWPRTAYAKAIGGTAMRRVALVAETGTLAGFAVASVVAPQAELETIAVAAQYQRQGIARMLFAELLKVLSSDNVTDVFLEVRASNQPARELYRALGFQQSGNRPRYYADPVEDAVLLRFRVG